jgi:hypothetical protein
MAILVDKCQAMCDVNMADLNEVLNSDFFFFWDLHGLKRKLSA